jgi:hypothetical protein
MGRRGNGEGSVRKRKDGRWEARYTVHGADGPKQRTVYGKTRKEVSKKLTDAMAGRDKGLVFDSKSLTVGEFLKRWLTDVVRPSKAHRTHAAHRQQVETHVIPVLGRVKLSALRA